MYFYFLGLKIEIFFLGKIRFEFCLYGDIIVFNYC